MSGRDEVMVDEQAVRDALEPLRPDAEAFLDGVRSRIEDGHAARHADPHGGDDDGSIPLLSPFLRRAASLLPPGLVTAGQLTAVSAKGAGKAVGWKGAGAYVALPVLALLAFASVLALAWRSSRRLSGDRAFSTRATLDDLKLWWVGQWPAIVIGLGVLGAVLTIAPAVGVLLFVLGSLLVSLVVLQRLGAAGLATRQSVGAALAGLLSMLTTACILLDLLFGAHVSQHLSVWWSYWVLLVGSGFCTMLSRRDTTRIRVVTGAAFAVVLGWVALPGDAPSRADVVARLETGELPGPRRVLDWADRSQTIRALRADGGPPPDLARDRAAVESRLARGESVNEDVVLAAIRAGALPANASDGFADLESLARGGIWLFGKEQLTIRSAAFAAADPALRGQIVENLRERLDAALQDPLEYSSFSDVLVCLELLEIAGADAELDASRAAVRALLVSAWNGTDGTWAPFAAGFGPPRTVFGASVGGAFDLDRNCTAVEIMLRVGVPETVDISRLRAWFDDVAGHQVRGPFRFADVDESNDRAAAFLSLLDARFPPPVVPTWRRVAGWLADESVFLGLLALTVLCVAVTWRTPWGADRPRRRRRRRGAASPA